MTEQQRLDTLNLHIYLGKKTGQCVGHLIKMRQQRYLKDWNLYL